MIPETVTLFLHFQYGWQFGFPVTKFELRAQRSDYSSKGLDTYSHSFWTNWDNYLDNLVTRKVFLNSLHIFRKSGFISLTKLTNNNLCPQLHFISGDLAWYPSRKSGELGKIYFETMNTYPCVHIQKEKI